MKAEEFEEKAAALDRNHDYTGAKLDFSVEVKVNGQSSGQLTGTATYEWAGDEFEVLENNLPSSYTSLAGVVTTYNIDNFMVAVSSLEQQGLEVGVTYGGSDKALSATIKGTFKGDMSGVNYDMKISLEIKWDEHGLVKSAVEVDDIKASYQGQSAKQWGKSVCTFTYTK